MTLDIEVDSMVQRTSGGPMMLVVALFKDDLDLRQIARCAWFDGHKLDGADIPTDLLVLMAQC